jgi:hypothetical protein
VITPGPGLALSANALYVAFLLTPPELRELGSEGSSAVALLW